MRNKLFSVVAVVAVAGAIGAAPASASSSSVKLPANVASVCANPAAASLCSQATTAVQNCTRQRNASAIISCLRSALNRLGGSAVTLPAGVSLPAGLSAGDISKLLGSIRR